MPKITNINRASLREIEERVRNALKDLGDELGIDFTYGGGTYGGETGIVRLGCAVRDNGSGMSGEEALFGKHCRLFGLEPSDYNRTFWVEGHQYRLVGVKPSRPKFPMEVVRVGNGKTYTMTSNGVRSGLDREDAKTKKTA